MRAAATKHREQAGQRRRRDRRRFRIRTGPRWLPFRRAPASAALFSLPENENVLGFVRASVSRSIASIAGRPDKVWMVQVKASTSRQRPSGRNSSAAAAVSCACSAASKLSSQRCASAGAVACLLSATFIITRSSSTRCSPYAENVWPLCRHARLYAGHPRLHDLVTVKTWMAGTSPAMTSEMSRLT